MAAGIGDFTLIVDRRDGFVHVRLPPPRPQPEAHPGRAGFDEPPLRIDVQ